MLANLLVVAALLETCICGQECNIYLDVGENDSVHFLQTHARAAARQGWPDLPHFSFPWLTQEPPRLQHEACKFSWDNCSDVPNLDDWDAQTSEAQILQAVPEDWECLNEASLQAVLADQAKVNKSIGKPIPKILHQSWKSHDLSSYADGSASQAHLEFMEKNPGWKHRLWNDTENDELMSTARTELLEKYKLLDKIIYRIDMVRPLYLWLFGGVYADLDYKFYRDIEPALEGHGVLLATMQTPRVDGKYCRTNIYGAITNSFMAGVPGHPFWRVYLELIRQSIDDGCNQATGENCCDDAEQVAGPGMLMRALKCYRKVEHHFPDAAPVDLAEPRAFSPCSWADEAKFKKENWFHDCQAKAVGNHTFAATFWSKSWSES